MMLLIAAVPMPLVHAIALLQDLCGPSKAHHSLYASILSLASYHVGARHKAECRELPLPPDSAHLCGEPAFTAQHA